MWQRVQSSFHPLEMGRFAARAPLVFALALALSVGCEEDPPPAPPPSTEGGSAPGTESTDAPDEPGTAGTESAQPQPQVTPRPRPVQLPPHARPRTVAPPAQDACGVSSPLRLTQELRYDKPGKPQVRIVTPEPNAVIKRKRRLSLTVELTDFKTFRRANSGGNRLRVVLDDRAPQDWYDVSKPYVIDGLTDGLHSVRVYLVTALNETVKSPGAFAATSFYIGTAKEMPQPVDFTVATLSYHLPEGRYVDAAGHRVMVDFHLANAPLGAQGHQVVMRVDKDKPVTLNHWSPIYLESLAPGEHTITLQLRGPNGRALTGPFTRVSGKFVVERER